MKYILSIDQGTTGTTACLIDATSFNFLDKVNKEYPQIYPSPSWVEHNLNDIWDTVETTVREILKKNNISGDQIVSIGITNQRETTCAFNKKGEPLANAIVWQDRRTSDFCLNLKNQNKEIFIKEKTGLTLDPYFSASKMNWLIHNNQKVKNALANDDLLFGTIDTFLLFKLTGNYSHRTDVSNASRTMLMDLKSCNWDHQLLEIFQIPRATLPEICDSFFDFGKTKGLSFLPDNISITGILGDQQAALFGQAGISPGDLKCTYGTGAFLLFNIGDQVLFSKSGLLTTAFYRHKGKTFYAFEGSSYIAGAAVQWLRDNLKIINKSSQVEELALKVKNIEEVSNVVFYPYFSGIGSPFWKPEAKAAIIGLTRDTNDSHIAHACLEGICLSINDLIEAIKIDSNSAINNLKVDGGAVENKLLLELQSTISNLNIIKPKVIETTAFGAALASAIGSNLINLDDIPKLWKEDLKVSPNQKIMNYILSKKELWNKYLKQIFLNL